MDLQLNNLTNKTVSYSPRYILETKVDGEWYAIASYLKDGVEAIEFESDSPVLEYYRFLLSSCKGIDGKYRIGKQTGNSYVCVEFEVYSQTSGSQIIHLIRETKNNE